MLQTWMWYSLTPDGNSRLVCLHFSGAFWKYVLHDCPPKSYFWSKGKLEKKRFRIHFLVTHCNHMKLRSKTCLCDDMSQISWLKMSHNYILLANMLCHPVPGRKQSLPVCLLASNLKFTRPKRKYSDRSVEIVTKEKTNWWHFSVFKRFQGQLVFWLGF